MITWFKNLINKIKLEIRYRKKLRKIVIKMLETDQPIASEFELESDWLIFRRSGTEIKFSWSGIVEVLDKEDCIEVIMKPLGIMRIPKRIFDSAQEMQAWLDYIKVQWEQSKAESSSAPDLLKA